MPDDATTRLIDERLHELHDRHRAVDADTPTRYYTPGSGFSPQPQDGEDERFAISLATPAGGCHSVGDHERPFAVQSLAKVFTYSLALQDHGREAVMERVGVAPSGEAFNAIDFDERHHRPFNPMVNAGAMVAAELVDGRDCEERLERILETMRRFADNPALKLDRATLDGELAGGDRNRAIAYLMHSRGMLHGPVQDALWTYLASCSILATSADLAIMAATLAAGGVNPRTSERVLRQDHVRDVLSVMYTCGMYDFAGEWAVEVGVPAKSGISGGVLAVIPGKVGIAVFSPGLDEYGSSVRGTLVCEDISRRLGLHVFAAEDEDVLLRPGS